MTSSRSYYEILGVAPTADLQTLKQAFHRLSKTLHPDTTLLPNDEAAKKFRQVCEAYQLLSDPISRNLYDKSAEKDSLMKDFDSKQSDLVKNVSVEILPKISNRRPLSGGELFSLLLLCIALGLSLLLSIGFALFDGRELQINPSWLDPNHSLIHNAPPQKIDVNFTSS